jgi:hypothetical protein
MRESAIFMPKLKSLRSTARLRLVRMRRKKKQLRRRRNLATTSWSGCSREKLSKIQNRCAVLDGL